MIGNLYYTIRKDISSSDRTHLYFFQEGVALFLNETHIEYAKPYGRRHEDPLKHQFALFNYK